MSRHFEEIPAALFQSGQAPCIPQQIEQQAARTPDAIAVTCEGACLSYRELNCRANQLAHRLRGLGVGRETLVAIGLERSLDMVVGLLGILKAGGAYLPVDAAYPRERLKFMFEDARPAVVLTSSGQCASLPPCDAPTLLLDGDWAEFAALPCHDPEPLAGPEDLAYVIYTSGSTGQPKGCQVTHANVARLFTATRDWFHFGPGDVWTFFHSHAFDFSVWEIWGALIHGGRVVVVPYLLSRSPEAFHALLVRERVTVLNQTPSAFRGLIHADLASGTAPAALSLRYVILGGEALELQMLRPWFDRHGDQHPKLINMYGITETTVHVTYRPLDRVDLERNAGSVIGEALPDLRLFVLDPGLAPVAVGEVGEIYVAGAGVSRGYLNRPELTAERFLDWQAPDGERLRLYKTGDLARPLADGDLVYLGRSDHQVKIRGFRIETGEIESVLGRHDAVRACAVIARNDGPDGEVRLVAYVVPAGVPASHATLRAHLATAFPDYMLPSAFVDLEALPLTENGKLDRHALPAPARQRPELASVYEPPVGPVEASLCVAFGELLGIDHVGRLDNFFALGGDSLLALKLLQQVGQGRGNAGAIPTSLLFHNPTPATLAAALNGCKQAGIESVRLAASHRAGNHPATEPIAIVAMAGRFPGAADVEAFWHNLCEGRDSITVFGPEELDPAISAADRYDPAYVPARGVIDGVEQFDAAFFGIGPREAELMDPQQRVFLELAWECMERGGHVPDATPGPVGVFAGMFNASYFQRHVSAHPDLIDKVGAFQVMLNNEKDFIATRVAHMLNLTGPAISVHTACSTSLVAICQAADSLRLGHCDMALAGGVSVTCPPRSGHFHQEGAMLSPDGHTRPFDAKAQGTVFSDGAAVVLLKRLSDAVRDGNQVHAVLLGCAVNNDGGGKASFTAPSSAGQAAVIAMAHERAQVDPRSIGYVETHGTATPMGDPIEIEGLTKAFRRGTDATGFCRIGSVKSNVGHLVIAAGAAGVIKTALALAERRIPASLHFDTANPAIDFSGSPFVVNAALTDWPSDGAPRRAGVSSFGVGGTNAHVVMEEAPALPASDPAIGPQLLVLSARTPAALARAATQLADHLEARVDDNLADVAWTLAAGRKAFAHRVAIVAEDSVRAAAQLRSPEVAAAAARGRPARHSDVVFLFPGQGATYAGMGRGLHASEPAFRAAFDECAESLRGELGFDLRERAFDDDPEALLPTSIMQPATFALEYALARMWMHYGLVPAAMVGHSVGEFVAATLAGVFTLPDALRLVARRGALMQAQPAGGMLSVRLAQDDVLARLPPALSLAAENAPGSCVVAGPLEAMARFQAELEAAGVGCRALRTSHAFHSQMMEPVVAPLRAEVAALQLSAPLLPLVSTATGDWLDAATAMSPDYWASHLRQPVRFATALGQVLDTPSRVLLEVGPRATLSTLARQHPALQQHHVTAVATLADAPALEPASWRLASGQLWMRGVALDPGMFDRRPVRRRLRLPTYPFERQRFWVEAAPAGGANVTPQAVAAQHPASMVVAGDMAPYPAGAGDAPPARPATTGAAPDRRTRLLAQVKAVLEDFAGFEIADGDVATNFMELGLDSLMLTQVASHLQKTFATRITFRQLMGECATLDRLAEMLDRQLPPETLPPPQVASIAASMPVLAPLPVVPVPPLPPALAAGAQGVDGNYLRQLIDQQMQLMAAHVALLTANGIVATPAAGEMALSRGTLVVEDAAGIAPAAASPLAPEPAPPPRDRRRSRATRQVAVDYDPFAEGELSLVVPTTESQQEIWLADQLGREASLAFNLSVSLRFHGQLDVEALRGALQELVDRHDALRARVGPDGETLCIQEHFELPLQTRDFSSLGSAARMSSIDERLRYSVEAPFALDSGPLFRAELLCVAEDEHLLLLTAHHIACDGWSWWLIVRELGASYGRRRGVSCEPLPEPTSFAEYALAEADHGVGAEHAADEAYWLSCFPGEVPVLELPTDRPRPSQRSFASARADHTFDAALLGALRSMGARRGASLFSTLLAGFSGLLSRLSGQSEVVVGIPAAGQPVGGYDSLIGHCVNTLPLQFRIDPSQPFTQAIDAAQATLLDALEHQRYTFGTLLKKLRIRRDPARIPLVSAMFNLDQALDQESTAFPGLAMEFESNPRSFETFELFVNAVQVRGELRLQCQYNRDLYDAETVHRWLRAFETLLRAAVERESVEFGGLPLVDAAAQAELSSLQPVPVAFDRACRMHEHFEAQCDRTPDRTAVRFGPAAFSYAELEDRANRIAHLLRGHGVHRGALVGLAVDRSFEMLAAMLGVLKAGAGYVPLDPQFPHDRLAYMAADAGLAALLTTRQHAPVFDLRGRPVLELDELAAELAAIAGTRIGRDDSAADPEGIAYVIYTSGSTGRPKGVKVPHRAVANFLVGMQYEPGLCADDRLLAVTTLSFDIAVLELLLPLSVGAEVVLADRETAGDGIALAALLASSHATVMQGTPSTWRLLLEAGWSGTATFKALCGGEALAPELAAQLLPRCGALWNLYGPTETTVWSTAARIVPPQGPGAPDVSIGRPIANTRVWVLDPCGELCPRGVPGELCIGGEGVTLGYLDRPELTAERFIRDRFGTDLHADPAVLYRTGDRGRWRADGQLEHQGRLDFQVKIRGYRIELGEVENILAQHPGLARVTAMAREDRPGDVRLVAYVVPQAGVMADEAGWISHLRGQLPEYMVPQHFISLDAMPLLPNGKVDRKSLPAPMPAAGQPPQSRAPRNETEARIATIMADVLGLPVVGVDADFFALGGHSLLGARLLSRIGQALGVRLPLRTLFEASTVERLAEVAEAAKVEPATGEDVPRHANQSGAPLSLMQQRLWVQEQIQPGQATYNIASAYRLRGSLDVHALESALGEVVRRQSTLRTELAMQDDAAVQRVHETLDVALPLEDLSALPPGQGDAEALQRMVALSAQPIPMGQAPLFRACLYRLSADTHLLFFMVHHAIWDGVSQELFCTEMAALYEAYTEGRQADLPQLERSYVDFVHWHLAQTAKPGMQEQLAHWKAHLAGHLEPLHLPEDHPRPTLPTGQGGSERVQVDGRTLACLRQVGASADASLFMTLLAGYFVWLHRMTGQQDLVVGVPVRNHVPEAMDRVMGFFVNILPLRVHVDPALSFLQLLVRVRQAVLDCFTHPDVPLETLVSELGLRRDPSRAPIYQALFSFQETGDRLPRWGALSCEQVFLPQATATNDLSFWCSADAQGLVATLNYNADIILAASAARMGRRFEALLASLQAEPDTAVGDVNFLGAEDRKALEGWNATGVPLHAPASLHAMLAEQSRATPNADAVHFGGQVLSYAQLGARSERIASALAARGVGAGDLVGVCLGRHTDLVATTIGVLVAGAAYVPLDPAYPPDRLRFMAEDAGLALVVSEGELAEPLLWPREKLLLLDADAAQIESAAFAGGFPSVGPDAPAYVIYTSGSTGKPKGVCVPHGAAVNFLRSMRREPGIAASDRLLAVTTTSFDIAVLELFLPLTAGASVVLASREQVFDGSELARLLTASKATIMQATPSVWRLLLDSGWIAPKKFKALCGGEPLSVDLAQQLLAQGVELWNMYGPTETTVWSTCAHVRAPVHGGIPDIHIGRPIDNTTVWVLDPRGQPCPPGVSGEIHIGGAGVTLGYHERPELTAERFVADRFPGVAMFADSALPPRLYRTGDRGRWRHDGVLKHEGRLDYQVKLRGHRIEPGEIEAHLASHREIASALVIVREDVAHDQRLVAYVVANPGARVEDATLRSHLRGLLPAYMVPQHFVVLGEMPLLPNGKIDRNALPTPREATLPAPDEAGVAADPRVRYLSEVWSAMLGLPAGADDNFFDLGGHSMLAVQMASRVERDTGVRIKLIRLGAETLAQVASGLPLPADESATSVGFGARISMGLRRLFRLAAGSGQ